MGLSHLGTIWSAGYASLGFPVVAYDDDPHTVSRLSEGDLPIPEPGLAEQFSGARSRLKFAAKPDALRDCSIVFFAKDVPYDEEGRIDLKPIDDLLDSAVPHLRPHVEFIFMGQVPVGYTRKLRDRIHRLNPQLSFNLTYRVETLTIGQAVSDFLHPDRVIIGVADPSQAIGPLARSVLEEPFGCPLAVGSYESAEMTKSAINIYLANAVTFVNTISDLCENVGANIQEVVTAMKMDKRFSPLCYWRPGLGFAGGHLERDLMSLSKLSEEHGIEPDLLKTIIRGSKNRYQWLVKALEHYVYERVARPTLCLWGLAYKKGTDSLHNAHCLKIFRDYGKRAQFRVFDPVAKLPPPLQQGVVTVCSDQFEALQGADVLVVLTEWDQFKMDDPRLFLEKMNRPVTIIDGVHMMSKTIYNHPSITCVGMGIPVKQHAS